MESFKNFEPHLLITFLDVLKEAESQAVELNPFELNLLRGLHFDKSYEAYNKLIDQFGGTSKKRNPVNTLLKVYSNPDILIEILWHGFSEERRAYFLDFCKTNSITISEQLSGPYTNPTTGEEFLIGEYNSRIFAVGINKLEIMWLIKEYESVVNVPEFGPDRRAYFKQRLEYFAKLVNISVVETQPEEQVAQVVTDDKTELKTEKKLSHEKTV